MIGPFIGEYRWLSNFWPAPIVFQGELYATVEHAYAAAKTDDLEQRRIIRNTPHPVAVKRLGRTLTVREDWDEVKLAFMAKFVRQKFNNPELLVKLRATGNQNLVEINMWGDTFWGMCNGVGENHLGRILMEIRDAW